MALAEPEGERIWTAAARLEAVIATAYRADCISRRLCILDRVPVRVEHSGRDATRSSRNLWQVRSIAVVGLESL